MGICVFLSILFLLAFVLLIKEGKEGKKKEKQIEESLKQEWKERREKIFSPYEMEQIMYALQGRENVKALTAYSNQVLSEPTDLALYPFQPGNG